MLRLARLRRVLIRRGFQRFGQGSSIGQGVRALSKDRIRIGSFTRIDDRVYLNGLGRDGILIGDRCQIRYGSYLDCWKGVGISIGDDSYVGPLCIIQGQGGTSIGSNCLIAGHAYIVPAGHRFDDRTRPIRTQGETMQGIVIEDDVWLGCGTQVLDGVTIGQGSVIGAGSVVTRSIPRYSVAFGAPATVKRQRGVEGQQSGPDENP